MSTCAPKAVPSTEHVMIQGKARAFSGRPLWHVDLRFSRIVHTRLFHCPHTPKVCLKRSQRWKVMETMKMRPVLSATEKKWFQCCLVTVLFLFWDRFSPFSSSWPRTHCSLVYSASQVLVSWIDMCHNLSRCWKAEMGGILGALCILAGLFLCFRNWQAGVLVLRMPCHSLQCGL